MNYHFNISYLQDSGRKFIRFQIESLTFVKKKVSRIPIRDSILDIYTDTMEIDTSLMSFSKTGLFYEFYWILWEN